jgi:hypothetical protein
MSMLFWSQKMHIIGANFLSVVKSKQLNKINLSLDGQRVLLSVYKVFLSSARQSFPSPYINNFRSPIIIVFVGLLGIRKLLI